MWFEKRTLPSLARGKKITLDELAVLQHSAKHAVSNIAAHTVFAVYVPANTHFPASIGKRDFNCTYISEPCRLRVEKITCHRRLYLCYLAFGQRDWFARFNLGKCRCITSRHNQCGSYDCVFQNGKSLRINSRPCIANKTASKQAKLGVEGFGGASRDLLDVV